MKQLRVLLLSTVILSMPTAVWAQETAIDRFKRDLICTCPCPHQLGQCGDECGIAPQLIAELEGLLAEQSEEEVLRTMEARYGAMIYAAPRAEGWGLVAWMLPAIGVLFGGLLVWGFLKRSQEPVVASAPTLSPDEERKYRAQLQRELQQD